MAEEAIRACIREDRAFLAVTGAEARPFLARLRATLFSPRDLVESLRHSAPVWWEIAERLPLGLAELLERRLVAFEDAFDHARDKERFQALRGGARRVMRRTRNEYD